MKTTRYALAALGLIALLGPSAVRADDFTFSFTNTFGNVSGTVTGQVLGLTDDGLPTTTAEVILTGYPSAFLSDPDLASPPVDVTSTWTVLSNSFTETAGNITFSSFIARTAESSLALTFPKSFLINNVTSDNDSSTNLTFTPLSAVPEPSSLLLLGTGLVGMLGALKRKLIA